MISKYKLRVSQGLCGQCGKSKDTSSNLCSLCKTTNKARKEERELYRKENLLCIKCGQQLGLGVMLLHCNRCLLKQKYTLQQYHHDNPEKCRYCPNKKEDLSKSGCTSCLNGFRLGEQEKREKNNSLGLCKCGRERTLTRQKCSFCLEGHKNYKLRLRLQVINAYGKICVCCGEDDLEFLHIDHINGHRQTNTTKRAGHELFLELVQKNFPPGFQVLCANCNSGKELNGGICPKHEKYLGYVAPRVFSDSASAVRRRIRYKKVKEAVFEKYGGTCVCCRETQLEFLNIDHVLENGSEERKSISGRTFYEKLFREPINSDYQILCFSCNQGKTRNNGVCPKHNVNLMLT